MLASKVTNLLSSCFLPTRLPEAGGARGARWTLPRIFFAACNGPLESTAGLIDGLLRRGACPQERAMDVSIAAGSAEWFGWLA